LEDAKGLLTEQGTIRAFVAVGLPDLARDRLAAYLAACREVAPAFRWVAPESLHLTVRFVGRVDPAPLDSLAASLRSLAFEPFPITLGGLGTFGRGAAIRVVWLGLSAGADELTHLASEAEARCAAVGFEPEARPYHPHLTLARSRQRRGERLAELPPPPELSGWMVTGFRLYRSRLAPGGATYSVLEEFGS
jgi:2'-5' RNA ligase